MGDSYRPGGGGGGGGNNDRNRYQDSGYDRPRDRDRNYRQQQYDQYPPPPLAEAASLSEAPLLADRATDLSRTSLLTPLARGHQMASRPSQRAPPTTGLGGLTETAGDPAMRDAEEVRVLHAVEEASAALARSQHMIALF
jgi:hypothetical protein